MNTLILGAVAVTVLGVAIVFLGLMRVVGKRNEHPQRSRRNKVLAIVGIVGIVLFACCVLGMAGRAWLFYQFDYFRGSEAKWDAAWSPDGKRIAFVSDQDGDENIYVMNTDGSNVTQLTSDPFRYYYILRDPTDEDPAWSPDGKQIAFVSGRSGSLLNPEALNIYVRDANGSNVVRLTGQSKNSPLDPITSYAHPAWSPDGKKIAFGHGNAIYMMNADGTSLAKITDAYQPYANEISPSWSPDGTYITFADDRDNNSSSDIYIIRTDGSGRKQLVRNFVIEANPAWSPDGKKIIFAGRAYLCTDCNLYIYVTYLAGAYPVKLAEYPSEIFLYKDMGNFTWSPNGDRFALSDTGAIYIMNTDGSNLKYLTGIR
jgi:dipeptidyl aminopeptidase/acylaminoacyl peptidase